MHWQTDYAKSFPGTQVTLSYTIIELRGNYGSFLSHAADAGMR